MNEIRRVLDQEPVAPLQYVVIALCLLMNMLDGMDVMVIAYAAPSLAKAWSIEPGTLGMVFSAGLVGMTLGGMLLAPIADRIGRRRMMIFCILVMGVGTLLTAYTRDVLQLVCLRFVSGLGIGAMLATSSTMAAEYLPTRMKNFGVSLVLAGYSAGAALSGLVAARLIPAQGWESMFIFAGIVTLATLVLVLPLLPESLEFLARSDEPDALEKLNRVLARMRRAPLVALPSGASVAVRRASVRELFASSRKSSTIWLWTAFFLSFATLYFLVTWIPKLASNTGLSLELAIYAGTVFNLGGFVGTLIQGAFSSRFELRRVICVFLLATAVLMVAFGYWQQPWVILLMFGLIGFGMQGGFVGLYAVAAWLYPVEIRNTAIGWGIGAGRIGAVAGPMLGGALVAAGLGMTGSCILFAVPLVLSAFAILRVGTRGEA